MSEPRIRCGDVVSPKSRPEESWIVAYADYEQHRLAWFGWPEGTVALEEVTLIESCTDEVHARRVSDWLDKPHARAPYGGPDHRVSYIRRLYRPEEHRRLESEARRKRIAEIEAELARLRAEEETGT